MIQWTQALSSRKIKVNLHRMMMVNESVITEWHFHRNPFSF